MMVTTAVGDSTRGGGRMGWVGGMVGILSSIWYPAERGRKEIRKIPNKKTHRILKKEALLSAREG